MSLMIIPMIRQIVIAYYNYSSLFTKRCVPTFIKNSEYLDDSFSVE